MLKHHLSARLRERIFNRIAELKLKDFEAAEQLGLSPGQPSRLLQALEHAVSLLPEHPPPIAGESGPRKSHRRRVPPFHRRTAPRRP
jgi:hypothetical protein